MVDVGLFGNQMLTGVVIGSRLFLVAVGLSLIFGVLGVLNFAHGVFYMIGAYVTIVAVQGTVGNFWVGVLLAGLVVGMIGAAIEVAFVRRVYDREPLDQLLLTFAFVLILTDVTRYYFGSGTKAVTAPDVFQITLSLPGGFNIFAYRAFVIVVAAIVMAILFAVLKLTNVGRVVRATSSDREMAGLLGIDVPRLYTGVFFAGSVLAGIGGAFGAPLQSVTPELGNLVIINAFVVVVIGGLGSFFGAFVGAMIIGLMIALGTVAGIAGAGQLFPFVAMIVVLLLKPEGLFGRVQA